MNRALDLLDLRSEEKTLLSCKTQGLPISEEELTLFLQGKEMSAPFPQQDVLSVLTLFDSKENISYPLMFHHCGHGKDGKVRKLGIDILNPLAMETLRHNGIDISDSGQWTRDPSSVNFLLGTRLQFQGKGKGLTLVKELHSHPVEALDHALIHETLHRLFSPSQRPQKYYGLFSSNKKTGNLSSLPRAFLNHRYEDIQTTIESTKAIRVSYRTKDETLPFLTSFLLSCLRKRESVLFLSARKEDSFLKETGLQDEVFPLSQWTSRLDPPARYFERRRKGNSDSKEVLSNLKKARSDYRKVASQRRQGFRRTKAFLSQVPQQTIKELLGSPFEIMPLSLGDYQEQDFRKDLRFLTILSRLDEIEKVPLKDFLYFGLSVSGKEENYQEIQQILCEIVNSLSMFIKKLDDAYFLDIDGNPIHTFAQFEDYGECIHLLSGYTGFPRKYFDMEIDEEELLKLKKLYQDRSSSRLLFRALFQEEKSVQQQQRLFEGLTSPSFLKRRKTQRELQKRIGHKTGRKERETIVRLLEESLANEKEYSKTIESYATLYGDSVRTMNGVVEILSNRSYIQRFRAFEKRKGISMDHPLIKKGLRDRRYAQSLFEEFSRYDKEYQAIKGKINRYIGYFLDDRRDFLHMDIDEMILFFQKKQGGSYPLFSQYAQFLKESKELSLPLQLALRRRILSGKTLEHLRRDYLPSLLFGLYEEERRSLRSQEAEWVEKRSRYLEEIRKLPETIPLALKEALQKTREERMRSISFQDTDQRVRALSRRGEKVEHRDIAETLPVLHPLLSANREDLAMLGPDMVDVLIVEDSRELCDSALLLALSSAKKVLFLQQAGNEDLRISGYEQATIDRPSLYISFYDNRMDEPIEEFFKTILRGRKKELLDDEPIYPYLLLDKERDEREVVFFDLLIPSELEEETDIDLREFFAYVDHLPCHDIDMIEEYIGAWKKAEASTKKGGTQPAQKELRAL